MWRIFVVVASLDVPETLESPYPADECIEDDASLEFNLPWVKPVTELIRSFNLNCTHQGFCHNACVKRQARAAKRLMETMRQMYGEKIEYIEEMFINEEDTEEEKEKRKWAKWSESASTSPDHRKELSYRQNNMERSKDILYNDCELKEKDCKKRNEPEEMLEDNPGFLKYLQLKVRGLFHAPQSVINKASCIIDESLLETVIENSWELLL